MEIPAGAIVFIWGVALFVGLLLLAGFYTIYDAASEAREFYRRENERFRQEQHRGDWSAPPARDAERR